MVNEYIYKNNLKNIRQNLKSKINYKVDVKAPGRVNLIGEHTDYNGGYVLPCALNLSINLTFKINNKESTIKTDLGYSMKLNVNNSYKKSSIQWENYVLGVIEELRKIKSDLNNFSCDIKSTLPSGAGISSSSALVCGLIKGISIINNLCLDNPEIIEISRRVEHNYIGVLGGIMDQYTILNAKQNKAILLNCYNLNTKYIGIDFGDLEILLLDTNIKHNLASTEYNTRVKECKQALKIINLVNNKKHENLSQVSLKEINNSKNDLSLNQYKRAFFVFNENRRVIKSVEVIENDNLSEFGELMYQSHEGLKNNYEVSCKELDFLVDQTKKINGVIGARMMGGGFGGCTVNLIKSKEIPEIVSKIKENYKSNFGINLKAIIAKPGSGIKVVIN